MLLREFDIEWKTRRRDVIDQPLKVRSHGDVHIILQCELVQFKEFYYQNGKCFKVEIKSLYYRFDWKYNFKNYLRLKDLMRKVRRYAKGFLRVKMKRFVAIVICLIVILFLAMQCYINMLQCSGCYDNKNNQTMVDKIASNIQIQYQIIDNKEGCTQKIIIINKGCENITVDEDWAIYFYSFGLIEATLYPYPGGLLFRTPGLRIHHLSGYLYKITPDKEKFENLVLNANISIQFKSRNFISTKTDVLPNWYVSAKNIPPKIIVSTLESKFKTSILVVNASSMMRYANDMTRKLSVEDRYELNDKYVIDIGRAPNIVIPTPYNTSIENDVYLVVSSNWVVLESKHFINEVKYLSGQLSIPQRNIRPGHSYVQFIKLKSNISFTHKTSHKTNLLAESYELTVDPGLKRITIKSFTNAGAFYAIQSLLSVGRNEDGKFIIPKLTIKDQPRFGYRGFHLDVARNFRKKSEVLKILNIMSMYKLNKFHFHLTDDEGWRLEIPGLLELTQIGAYRCHSNDETECLSPQLGSGPFKESSGSGYYSVRDYQDILKHANKLHIQVIPEFDMPGHARAAIKSMEYRYKKLKEDNVTAAGEFLLTELGDQSVYKTIQAFTDNAVNPCIESTYTFIRHLVGEVKRMHESIQPLQYFHYGGDEVPAGAWENSTACTSLLKIFKDFKTVKDLKKNFIRRVLSILQSEDLIAGAWEDGLAVDKKQLNRSSISFPGDIYAYAWNNVWQDRKSHTAHNLANDGYKVILAHATHFYFDHPYEADFDERGLSWATRQITVRDVFNYMPLNFLVMPK
ncbi:hypothetical protein KUTeg_014986 [Tegillarca granosa]|uniref:beta-N-acetylhexosaminidase n=1 Tax=Tegillarca granosa TaxID=220873 RepID=A0ABQ9ESG7_TEGGR|nr:hypothetical protein KUTeg_014986 [Tegillarca granosa]